MPAKKRPQLQEVLKEVEKFFCQAAEEFDATDERIMWFAFDGKSPSDLVLPLYFPVEDLGIARNDQLEKLVSTQDAELISHAFITLEFNKALKYALGLEQGTEEIPIATRGKKAARALREALQGANKSWLVYFAIDGIQPEKETFNIGPVKFLTFDSKEIDLLKKRINHPTHTPGSSMLLSEDFSHLIEGRWKDKTVACVDVFAADYQSAHLQAYHVISSTLNILNYYVRVTLPEYYLPIKIQLPRSLPLWEGHIIIRNDDPHTINIQRVFNHNEQFTKPSLSTIKSQSTEFSKVLEILSLAVNHRSQVEQRLITSLQWAGKATTKSEPEDSFLLYAISLEALLMEKADQGELTNRLALRTAHLIGTNVEERSQIYKRTIALYKVRSQ